MAAFATPDDVAAAWRSLTAPEETLATTHLAYASEIIRSKITDVDTRIAAGTLSAELVKHITVAMVIRRMQNPEGTAQVSEAKQIDDYQQTTTRTLDKSVGRGGLFLTDEELSLLTSNRSGAFSVRPHREPATADILERAAINRQSWQT